jgi:acyl-CoA synthetase (AMP-forming)/AMP-acid ligase II
MYRICTILTMMTGDPFRFSLKHLLFDLHHDPDHPAIESPGCRPLTYRALQDQVLEAVRTLNGMGFRRNDRIAIIMPAGAEAVVILVSVMAGFTAVPLNPQFREREMEEILSRTGIKAVITEKGYQTAAAGAAIQKQIPVIELVPRSGEAGTFDLGDRMASGATPGPEFARSSDTAFVLLTSGTTARPKIVPVTHEQSFVSKIRNCKTLGINGSELGLLLWPHYHSMGIAVILDILLAGGTILCVKDFIPSDFAQILKENRLTYYSASPAIHTGILKEIRKLSPDDLRGHSLRCIESAADSLPEVSRRELEGLLGVPVIDDYGSSETGLISSNTSLKPGSVGVPVIDHLRVIDEHGTSTGPFVIGEIVVKGETVFSGYEDAPGENTQVFLDGWFRTGDRGYLDPEGYLYLSGRQNELINKGGEKISPEEIDSVLRSHPQVKDAMTFPVNDPVLGEEVAAMVVRTEKSLSEMNLRTFLLDRLAPFKIPARLWFVEEIPKTPTGKRMRKEGRRQFSRQ